MSAVARWRHLDEFHNADCQLRELDDEDAEKAVAHLGR
jgi:hypothetical protein